MATTRISPDRNALVMRHYSLVCRVAKQVHARLPQSVDLGDLINVGTIGLIDCVDRFDPSRGVAFQIYARHRIRGSILDSLRAVDWVPHSVRRKAQAIEEARRALHTTHGRSPTEREMAERLQINLRTYRNLVRDSEVKQLLSLDAPANAENPTPLIEQVASSTDLEEETGAAELRQLVVEGIQQLPEREALALTLYYFHELQLKDVGKHLSVTESRACQLCRQGVRRLRRRFGQPE